MKKSRLTFLLLVSLVPLGWAVAASAQSQQVPVTAIPGFYEGLDATQATLRRGESTFYQRCSFCHLPRIRKAATTPGPAPSLSGLLKGATPEREALAREYILKGSDRMPGWQYALKPAQIDELIAYMKTL
jgi:mono/diheme cytochrome c family protein